VVSHVYAPGVWPLSVTVTDQSGAVNTRQVTITVAAAGPGPNLCGNPSFEANTTGWNSFGSASYQRVPGGFSGTSAVELTGTGGTLSSFGLNDGPNWVGATGPLGTRYRFGAWVRSTSSTGMIRLQVREYVNDVKVGASTLSTSFALSPQWQLVWVDHVTQAAGSALDVQVQNSPVSLGETFRVDEVTIHIIPADEPIAGSGDLDPPPEGPKLPGGGAKDDEPGAGATNAFSARVVPAVTRSTAALQFTLIARSTLRVDLFDASGRHVRALLDDAEMAPGLHSLNFDARDDHGDRLASGVYFYRVQAAERSVAGRFVIVR
jgi:hypothetical protein